MATNIKSREEFQRLESQSSEGAFDEGGVGILEGEEDPREIGHDIPPILVIRRIDAILIGEHARVRRKEDTRSRTNRSQGSEENIRKCKNVKKEPGKDRNYEV